MDYKRIKKILEKKGFRGLFIKRVKANHLAVTFMNISYYAVEVVVEYLKVNPKTFGNNTLVVSISFNGEKVNDFKEFMNTLDNVRSIHKKAVVKTFKKA